MTWEVIISGRWSTRSDLVSAAHQREIERGRRADAPGSSDDRDLHVGHRLVLIVKSQMICVYAWGVAAANGPRCDVRRLPRVRAHDALRKSRVDGDLLPHRPSRRSPLRARAPRELGRRHGDGLGDRARQAGARDPAHDAGLGNAVSALATARVNRAPLVVVVGQQDRRHLATEPFLAGRLHGLAGDYPVWVDQPVRAQDVPGAIARASPRGDDGARAGRRHRADGRLGGGRHRSGRAGRGPPRRARARAVDEDVVSELADLLAGAESPVLVVGAGADDPDTWARSSRWPSGSPALSGRSRSAPAPASRRITPSSRATCRPTGYGCARRSRRTTSCSPSAPRCSGSTRSWRARSSSRGRGSRWSARTRPRCTGARPTSRCSRHRGRCARGSRGSSRPVGRLVRGRSRVPAPPEPPAQASRFAPPTSSARWQSACRAMRS